MIVKGDSDNDIVYQQHVDVYKVIMARFRFSLLGNMDNYAIFLFIENSVYGSYKVFHAEKKSNIGFKYRFIIAHETALHERPK